MCPSGVSLRRDAASKTSSLRPAFEILDVDCDGKISHEDLCSFYAGLSGDNILEEDVIGTMISAADTNHDGYVVYEEFERVVEQQRMGRRRGGVMEDVFGMMDGDGDGKLSREDIKGFMRSAGIGARDKDVEEMVMLACGGDKGCVDGGVTYDVFLKILGFDDFF